MNKNCIRVYCRLKPNLDDVCQSCFDYQIFSDPFDEGEGESLVIRGKHSDSFINNKPDQYQFRFHKVFDEVTSQAEIYEVAARPVVEGVIKGYNGTIFAYGQTGSGKTFTISGFGLKESSEEAIVHRSLMQIFKELQHIPSDDFQIDISFMEIYNEIGCDLLNNETDRRIILQEDEDGEIQLRNLTRHSVKNYNEFLNLYKSGENNRSECTTLLNQFSSRSHCILTVYVTVRMPTSKGFRKSKLHLVDLAGSERISKIGLNSQTIVEARHINLSLLYLEQVIVALGEKHRIHIPYRNSMMTTVLRDSLGGNCFTAMLATVATNTNNLEETLSTCRFAQRVALVKNEARLNMFDENMELDLLKAELNALKTQMSETSFKTVIVKFKKEVGQNLSENEALECQTFVENFINNLNNNCYNFPKVMIPIIRNPHKIRICFEIFKSVILDIQKKRRKAEKQAHFMYQRVLGTGSKNEESSTLKSSISEKFHSQKGSNSENTSKSSSTRPTLSVANTVTQTSIWSKKLERQPSQQRAQTAVKPTSVIQRNEPMRPKSCTHTNCVSHEEFKKTMNKLASVIEECREAQERELSKLDSIQKLMEKSVKSKKDSLTDFILKIPKDKISKLKMTEAGSMNEKDENITAENDIDYSKDGENDDFIGELLFTFDASKKYSEKDDNEDTSYEYEDDEEETNESPSSTTSEYHSSGSSIKYLTKEEVIVNDNDNYDADVDDNDATSISKNAETIQYNRNNSDCYLKNLTSNSEPTIASSQLENASFMSERNRLMKLNISKNKRFGKQSLQKRTVNQNQRKLFERRSELKCNLSESIDKNRFENIDISSHYEGNTVGNYELSAYHDRMLTEAKENAIKTFEEKYHRKKKNNTLVCPDHCCITMPVSNWKETDKKLNYSSSCISNYVPMRNVAANIEKSKFYDSHARKKSDYNFLTAVRDNIKVSKNNETMEYNSNKKSDGFFKTFDYTMSNNKVKSIGDTYKNISRGSNKRLDHYYTLDLGSTETNYENIVFNDSYDYIPKKLESDANTVFKDHNQENRDEEISCQTFKRLLKGDLSEANLSNQESDSEVSKNYNLTDFESNYYNSEISGQPIESSQDKLLPQNVIYKTELHLNSELNFHNREENVCNMRQKLIDLLPLTGDPVVDEEIISFYQKQISCPM